MVEVRTRHSISDIMEDPQNYIDKSQDIELLKIYKDINDPIWIMAGTTDDKRYYLTFETNENFRDEYPGEGETMQELLDKLITEAILDKLTIEAAKECGL